MKKIDYEILAYLRENPFKFGVTRTMVIEAVNYPRTTVLDSLVRLEVKGLVRRRTKRVNRKRGRPDVYWSALI